MKDHFIGLILIISISFPNHILSQQMTDSISMGTISPFHKRAYAFSGSVSYSSTSYPKDEQTLKSFTMSPTFLYFTSKKFAIGGQVTYSSFRYQNKYSDSQTNILGVGPQFRLYFFDAEPLIFCTIGIFMTNTSNKSGDYKYEGPTHSYGVVSLGIDVFIDSNLSLEPFVEYRKTILESSISTNAMTFGISFVAFNF